MQHYSYSRFFVSLHSFFLHLGIRTFAVDLFIAPSKEKSTVLKTYNTEHKRENSKHETLKSKHRSHKLWTQNSEHLHTKHNMCNGSLYVTLCFVYSCFVFCVHSLWLLCFDFWVFCCEFSLLSFVLCVLRTVSFLLEGSITKTTANLQIPARRKNVVREIKTGMRIMLYCMQF